MTVHVRWEIVPSKDREVVESCQGQVTACVIQDRLENLTYGGGYENISLVEFLNEFAKHHAQPEAINPEK
jgi:hypothetical protein